MLDLVRKPNCWFSRMKAHVIKPPKFYRCMVGYIDRCRRALKCLKNVFIQT